MDPNKYLCRNATPAAISSSTSAQPAATTTSATNGCGTNAMPDYMACDSVHSSTGFNCKELLARGINSNNKTPLHQRSGAINAAPSTMSGSPTTAGTSNTGAYCGGNSNSPGNYINVMPVPMGTLQYNRRKLTPQEYQSRLYYNTADYRCRDEFYSNGASGRVNTASPSPSLQLQSQHNNQQHHQHPSHPQIQHQQHQQQQQQPSHPQHHHHHQQISQQVPSQQYHFAQQQQQQQQLHYPSSLSNVQQQQQQHHQHQQHQQHQHQNLQQQHNHHTHHHHHQNTCGSSVALDPVEEALNCPALGAPSSRMMAATQTQPTTGNCEQFMASASLPLGSVHTATVPPIMYTVHRVVTTAQIQTAAGNTFASSSSISSMVSAVQNEADNVENVSSPGSAPPNAECFATNDSAACVTGILGADGNSNSINVVGGNVPASNLCTSPAPITTVNYSNSQTKVSDSARTANNNQYMNTASSSNVNCTNGTKTTTNSMPRPLQDVIPTCVYLMSRVAVHMEIEGTAQCPSQVMLAAALGCEELGIANKLLAQSIFGLWMTSALLDIQLKSHHRPFLVRLAWSNLLEKFSHGNPIEKKFDEPMIMLKRNVFFSKKDEEKIKDHRILELLYEEAKHNVLTGRYIMESVHSLMLGGIQARIELGPFNTHTHTITFFRENQSRFLPQHVAKNSNWSWLPVSRKNSAEVKLLEQFKRVPQTATTRKLMRKYLEFCWALPFYGAAFFHGQVEQPVRGLMSMVNHKDVRVLVAVNERGVFIIDPIECTLLLGLRYEDLSWDFAKPSATDDPECLTCIFIQFDAVENGIQTSKLMQVFSRQAAMIDALISHFADQVRKRRQDGSTTEQFHDEPNPIQNNGNGVLCNKLSRLTLATFDEEGRCIGQMGSLSISY
ncbi:FERM domain-containing protein 8 Bili isoform 1-T9 [Glossina fuscipes fuscipes]